MDPFQYVDRYHSLRVNDPKLGLDATLQLSKYRAGWFKEDIAEADTILGIIASKYLKKKSAYAIGSEFTIPDATVADTSEPFYPAGVRRAFASRGSPDEIADALRLAVLTKRCDPKHAKTYGEKWFGQDCNSFSGNYLGLSPMIAIFSYAHGLSAHDVKDSKHFQAVQSFLPFPPREDPLNITMGDLMVTFGSEDSRGLRYRHVGVVQNFTLKSITGTEGEASIGVADIDIAEWGQAGQAHHKNTRLDCTIVIDALKWKPKSHAGAWTDTLGALKHEKPFKGKVVIGVVTTDTSGCKALRIFLDSSGTDALDHRGWHCGTVYGV